MAIELVIAHATADASAATDFETGVATALARQTAPASGDPPGLRRVNHDHLPDPDEIDPSSLVLFVLPAAGTAFGSDVQQKLTRYLAPVSTSDGRRLIPICIERGREQATAPLTPYVSMHVHGLLESDLDDVVKRALLEMKLRVPMNAGLFISYRQLDGRPMVERLAAELRARRFNVWWDEGRDDNSLLNITGDAQETIGKAIQQYGFLLLVDTPQASKSRWVQEEVNIAWGTLMLPVLPVVVEPDPRAPVSRFRTVAALRSVLVDVPLDAQTADDVVEATVDRIERGIIETMTDHARSRRQLIAQTEKAFRHLRYQWSPQSSPRLLFSAEATLDSPATPGLKLRLLVQCSPYPRVEYAQINHLIESMKQTGPDHYQFGILMHNAVVSTADRTDLLRGTAHLLLLDPSDIPNVFTNCGITISC